LAYQLKNYINGTDGTDCEYNNIGEKAISQYSGNKYDFIFQAKDGPKKNGWTKYIERW